MKVDIWMPIYIGDYLSATTDLSTLEHGIYFLLLVSYWKKGFLPDRIEKLKTITKIDDSQIPVLQDILDEFFTNEDGRYIQKRVEEELEKAKNRSEAAKANAKKRWDKSRKKCNGNAGVYAMAMPNDMPNECSSPSPSPSIKKESVLSAKRIIAYLNRVANKSFKDTTKESLTKIVARLNTFSEEELKRVVDIKTAEWLEDEKMNQYLRPATLFVNDERVESYLNQCSKAKAAFDPQIRKTPLLRQGGWN